MARFFSGGASIDSFVDLPGLARSAQGNAAQALRIEVGTVPELSGHTVAGGENWSYDGRAFWLHVPDVARFFIPRYGTILVEPMANARMEDSAVYLTGTVLGAALQMRGHVLFHASAVLVDDGAALFCGGSGAGKSTLAAALNERGYPVLCDDFCVLSPEKGIISVFSDGRRLKLWNSAIEALDAGARRGKCVHRNIDKYYVDQGQQTPASAPVRHVFILKEAEAAIERLNLPDAAGALRANAYRPELVGVFGQEPDYLRMAATLASSAGVFTFSRAKNFARLDEGLDRLEAHWAGERGRAGGQ